MVMITAAPTAMAAQEADARPLALKPLAGEWWFTTWKILPKVWPLTQGAGTTVAVLDSGVQANLPEVRGAVVPGGDVTGDRANGEQDFNGVGDGHGTQMAALIAGQGGGAGMVGIAPEAKILPVVVSTSAADRTAEPDTVAAGIRYAANHGAQVIDISQVYPSASASGCDAAEQAAVSYAVARDIVVVAAEASNNLIGGHASEPASCAGVLAVGAVQHNRSLWPGDVPETYLTVVAPGAGLISLGRDGKLVADSGTRSAAALIAGAAALIRSRYPSMTWYQVIQRLIGTALPEGGSVPNTSFGFGIVRLSEVANATAFPVPASTPNPVFARYQALLASQRAAAATRRAAASASAAPRRTVDHVSAALRVVAVVGAVLVVLVVITMLVADAKRRPKRRRGRPDGFQAPVPWLPQSPQQQRIVFGQNPPELRVPPYSPVPEPRSEQRSPDSGAGEFYFPRDVLRRARHGRQQGLVPGMPSTCGPFLRRRPD